MKKFYYSIIILFFTIFTCFIFISSESISGISLIHESTPLIQKETILADLSSNGLLIKEVNLNLLKDDALISFLNNKTTEEKIYGFQINNQNNDYLYFYSDRNIYSNLTYTVSENRLIIDCTKSISDTASNKKLLLIEKFKDCIIEITEIRVKEMDKETTTIYEF